jgi:trans-aconitate 2-methyltransferase
MADWNTSLYLRFERERTQPSRDLLARITIDQPQEIVDLGCGPGNSTAILRERWPSAKIIGVDNSPAMLEQAKKTDRETEWRCEDIANWRSPSGVDLIFANASLHWLPDHETLLQSLLEQLKSGGTLAFQIPALYNQPATAAIRDISALDTWKITHRNHSPSHIRLRFITTASPVGPDLSTSGKPFITINYPITPRSWIGTGAPVCARI